MYARIFKRAKPRQKPKNKKKTKAKINRGAKRTTVKRGNERKKINICILDIKSNKHMNTGEIKSTCLKMYMDQNGTFHSKTR